LSGIVVLLDNFPAKMANTPPVQVAPLPPSRFDFLFLPGLLDVSLLAEKRVFVGDIAFPSFPSVYFSLSACFFPSL